MIVIAILAILSVIVIFTLNPSRLFDNFRDTRRVTDITSIHKAIGFIQAWNDNISYGTSTYVYISIPDSNSDCSGISGLPKLPVGYTYHCSSEANYKKTDGNGWIPIDFTVSSGNKYLSTLPVDPVNDTTYFYTYFPGGGYELTAQLTSAKEISYADSGYSDTVYEIGSPNRVYTPLVRDINLIGHWNFNEGSGNNIYDYSGNGHDAQWYGSGIYWSVIAESGEGVGVFDGSTDYIKTNSFAIPNKNGFITYCFWLNWSINDSKVQTVLGDNNYYQNGDGLIYIRRGKSSNALTVYYDTGTSHNTIPANNIFLDEDGSWGFYVVVLGHLGRKIKFYKNGELFSSHNTNNMIFPGLLREKYIGSYNHNPGTYAMKDYIDDVRIYNRELSEKEILNWYNKNVNKY